MLYLLFFQSLISAGLFLLKSPKHPSNLLLAGWFVVNSLNFLGMLLPDGLTSYIIIGYLPFLFLNGPIFYFYVKSLATVDFRFKKTDLFHLVPFVFVSIYRLVSITESVSPASFYHLGMPPRYLLIYSLISLSVLTYLVLVILLWRKHKNNLRNYFSSSSRKRTLDSVVVMIVLFALSIIAEFFAPLIPGLSTHAETSIFWFNQFNLGMLAFLWLIVGLMQPAIFRQVPVNAEERKEENARYQKSGLNKESKEAYRQTILAYLATQKPYLNPEYNLETMARDLNITRQNLSQTINDELGKNFYQLINEYRVMEFKRLLSDSGMKHLTFTGLAYESGFNSKSAFYRVFREITGETPTKFKQKS